MIFWHKFDKFSDHWIKGRKSPLEAHIQRCCICFWGCRSHVPLLIATSPRAQFDPSSKWRTWNRKHLNLTLQMEYMWNRYEITYISYIVYLFTTNLDVEVYSVSSSYDAWRPKHKYTLRYMLFHKHFRLLAAIFDFSLTPKHGSVQISPVALLDIENIGIAVGISLLSRIQAEISYPLPVTGRHLWYITHPDEVFCINTYLNIYIN